jgi:hypothetical protein
MRREANIVPLEKQCDIKRIPAFEARHFALKNKIIEFITPRHTRNDNILIVILLTKNLIGHTSR